ncbi:MAG: hypothetical protein IJS90_10070 [Clostridia bacterium]|nr:hypothetical protein [Clostridia bacterium]
MKKHFLTVFILVIWCVYEAFASVHALILAAGFAAAFLCAVLIKNKAVSYAAPTALTLGLSIYDFQFALRFLPVLLLAYGMKEAIACKEKTKKGTLPGTGTVYTAILVSGVFALSVLVYDISYASRNPQALSPVRIYWSFFGIFVFLICLIVSCVKMRSDKVVRKLLLPVSVCCAFCFACSAAGFLMNSFIYSFSFAMFPWLVFISFAAVAVYGFRPELFSVNNNMLEKLLSD